MSTPENIFETARNNATKFDPCNSNLVYNLAVSIWACYQVILEYDIKNTDETTLINGLKSSLVVFRQCVPDKISRDSISLSYFPAYLLKSVEIGINQGKPTAHVTAIGDSIELAAGCEQCINIGWKLDHMISIVRQLLLLLVHNCLDCLIGDDVFTLINKCIVLDHLGSRMLGEANFLMLIEKLNKKIKDSVLDFVREADVQQVVGNINYRLNKYKEATSSLCKFLDRYIENNQDILDQATEMEKILITLISIAYCHEKTNSEESLSKAIYLLEAVKSSQEIDLSKIDVEKDRTLKGKITIRFELCSYEIQTEVYHALSHFYNERAVFHKSQTQEDDILIARKYISIAKSRDKENAFHSCHGLICHESTNYWFAITLYNEALDIPAVKDDLRLKNELLFYLAQSEYAVGNQNRADEHLKEFIEFCNDTNNEDALAHARIMQVKSELSKLDLFSDELTVSYFHSKLKYIGEKKPSLYVPVSVQYEWKKIIYAINVFYYIYRIFKKEISLPDGTEEIIYNLSRYHDKNNELKIPHQIIIPKDKIKDNVKREDAQDKDCLYLLEYKGIKLLCLGDYFALPRGSNWTGDPRGIILREYEDHIVAQLETNDRPDVLLFTPSDNFSAQPGRTRLLRRILKSKVCVVANCSKARDLANGCNDAGVSTVHLPQSPDMFLQMGFCFRVYELLRNDLATPTPLLGLAPLGESKSYSYQAGIKTKRLLVPVLNNATVSAQTNPIKRTLSFLDRTRIEMQNGSRSIIDYRCAIKSNIPVIEQFDQVSFMAFFPNPMDRYNDMGNFTAPFIIADKNVFGVVKYIPPFRTGIIYSYPTDNFSTYESDYSCCIRHLNDPPFCIDSCANEDGNDCDMESFANETCLVTPCEKTNFVINLLRHIIPIYEISPNYRCLWRKAKVGNGTSGILLVIVNVNSDDKDVLLHKICKSISTVIAENPNSISFEDFAKQSSMFNREQPQPNEAEEKPEETDSPKLLSSALITFIKGHFRGLETARDTLYKYWDSQTSSVKGSAYNTVPNNNKKKLLDIFATIETLNELWTKRPPTIVDSEAELQNIWNSDNTYQTITTTLEECRKSN